MLLATAAPGVANLAPVRCCVCSNCPINSFTQHRSAALPAAAATHLLRLLGQLRVDISLAPTQQVRGNDVPQNYSALVCSRHLHTAPRGEGRKHGSMNRRVWILNFKQVTPGKELQKRQNKASQDTVARRLLCHATHIAVQAACVACLHGLTSGALRCAVIPCAKV